MIDRFLARVGIFGLMLILVLAVLTSGFVGGVIEHSRLAAQHEQQVQPGGNGADSQSQQGAQAGQQGESQTNENQNGADTGQTGEQGDHASGTTAGGEGGD